MATLRLPRTLRRFNPRDERGVSEALGAAMVLSIILAAFSTWYPTYARTSVYDSEAKHMDEVRGAFLKLQSGMTLLEDGESLTLSLRTQGEKPRFVPNSGRVGRVLIRGSPRPGVGSLLTESVGSQGCPESLRGEGGGWYELSPLIFLEKFWSMENWQMIPHTDDLYTPSPEWDPSRSAEADGSGSIHVAATASSLWWNQSVENCTWVRNLSNPLRKEDGVVKVTVGGKLMFAVGGTGWGSQSFRIRVEVEDNGGWKKVYENSSSSRTNGWVRFENSYTVENSVSGVRLYLEVVVTTMLISDLRGDLWVDEVSLTVGPPYKVEAEYSSSQLGSTGEVEQLTITTLLKTEGARALCTLSIYNPSLGGWEVVRDGTVGGEEEVWENALLSPQAYLSTEGKIRLRLRGENSTSFFKLCQDYLKLSLDYKQERSSGSVEFEMRNSQYPDQTYVYEDGAVILLQGSRGVMLSQPAMLSFRERGENEVEITVNRYFIVGGDSSLSQSGYVSLKVTSLGSYFGVQAGEEPNRENVVLEIKSPRKEIWREYLRTLAEELNGRGLNAVLDVDRNVLTVLGKVVEGGKKDIYYYERIYEFSVQAR
ncbi:MAG: hypothetical protein QXM46_04630 [Candidatus Hadarchaeales archaeon]